MNGLTGMEKVSHLEDKIYLTIEFVKKLNDEKERVATEYDKLRTEIGQITDRKSELEAKVDDLMSERDAIQLKVEAMLEALTVIDPEVAEAVGR